MSEITNPPLLNDELVFAGLHSQHRQKQDVGKRDVQSGRNVSKSPCGGRFSTRDLVVALELAADTRSYSLI